MEKFDIFRDIAERTGGDIYIGVVGPMRAGKSTFIRRFMELFVIPNITEPYDKQRTIDAVPQAGTGKTVMTVEPKFVPEEAVPIDLKENLSLNVRVIDCTGYPVEGAQGYTEDDETRMVRTLWYDEPIPFTEAAEIGTEKVICDHSTIGILVTTDGTIVDIPRENYVEPERKVVEKPVSYTHLDVYKRQEQGESRNERVQEAAGDSQPIRVAIVGKPNVGKSSLVNRLLGQERMTVSAMPGTTVDAVDTKITYDNAEFVLVDTAGLRRPARIGERLEELAVGRSLSAVKRADVAILVLDGTEPPTAQDRRIAGYIRRNAKASILLVNKVDLGLYNNMSQEAFTNLVLHGCRPVGYSNVLFVSCLTGKGINLVLPEVVWTYQEYDKRIETSLLNQVLSEITDFSPPPREGRFFYGTQVGQKPPEMVFFVKDPSKVPEDVYKRQRISFVHLKALNLWEAPFCQ